MGWRAIALTLWADWRRRQGAYGHGLRGLRWRAWRDQPDARRLQRLAQCWRDHGRALPGRWLRALEAAERAARPAGDPLRLARWLENPRGPQRAAMQTARSDFAAWLRGRAAAGSVCVVGNAGSLLTQAWGARIDAQAVVIRFNRWQPPDQDVAQALGRRLDVWVAAPDCRAPPAQTPTWAVITVADPSAAMADWPAVQALRARGVSVVTVPLDIWRALVDRLEAPPSAGVLLLAWLISLGLAPEGLCVTGIAEPATGRDHVLGRGHRRGRRHAWDRERQLVAQWRAAGLLRPLSPDPSSREAPL